jgi:hypothetical protein
MKSKSRYALVAGALVALSTILVFVRKDNPQAGFNLQPTETIIELGKQSTGAPMYWITCSATGRRWLAAPTGARIAISAEERLFQVYDTDGHRREQPPFDSEQIPYVVVKTDQHDNTIRIRYYKSEDGRLLAEEVRAAPKDELLLALEP